VPTATLAAVWQPWTAPRLMQPARHAALGPSQRPRSRAAVLAGHTTWTYLECGGVVYAPPVTAGCQILAGAAAVR
jgi:hypothetical protein